MRNRSSRQRRAGLLSLAATTLLLASACGSSSRKAGTATTVTPTKSPITIGALIDISGSSSGGRAVLAKVIPAWEKYINAKGGLGGHPVKVDIRDVASDGAKAQA